MFRLLLACAAFAVSADAPAPKAWDASDLGKVPAGWKSLSTGEKAATRWELKSDDKTKLALTQTGESPNRVFNLCIADEPVVADLRATASFKALSGKKDQDGGLVWRCQDKDDYDVARMNPLEDNFRLYKVVAGKRVQLATAENLVVKVGTRHTIAVRMKGDQIECSLDGKKYLSATDSTIRKAGRIGVWTKADAVTAFAGLEVQSAK